MKRKSQHSIRENIIFFIYRQQLLKNNNKIISEELEENEYNISKETLKYIHNLFLKQEEFINLINKYLKIGWHFNKLSNLEQAILLWSTYEILILKKKPAIIINEAVIITKKYFINSEYKHINAILQNISNNEFKETDILDI